MTALTHDAARVNRAQGLGFALLSAASFGLSGSLARGLMDAGWTAGAATLVRVAIAAVVLTVPALIALRGRWSLLRRAAGTVIAYGAFAVAGAQLFYFFAVGHLDVGVALLIEYLSPIVVVGYLWATRGHKPGRLTLLGAVVAMSGLVLLLDLIGGAAEVSLVGIGWALGAMVGASVYFVISGSTSTGLPPVTLAWGGLMVAAAILGIAAATGVLPVVFATRTVHLVPGDMPWWVAVLLLGIITSAVAYVVGIAATRRLGARLGSFIALTEVLAAALFAWALVGQAPAPIQIAGAALVLAGVVLVKLGEPDEGLAVAPEAALPGADVVPDTVPAGIVDEVARASSSEEEPATSEAAERA
ncbi:EamA family transporter [Demequina gelatinilytica]|uniref:EamA family transporter n=1 Tax=Demequina gelatinilytica TaxID=1638980 RepID=UPI0007826B1E|nr:DMT family transporter [Demequina gelatinilytica]